MRISRSIVSPLIGLTAVLWLASCSSQSTPKPTAQKAALNKVETRNNFVPKNDVEGQNYNARQKLSDDPTTIIWCSVYPTNPNVKPFTIPIVGKLTSGNKRPFPTSQALDGGGDGTAGNDFYSPELPGPDGFYGTSGEYRYGFDPAGNYHDVYGLEVYCTSVPNVIQKNTTQIAITVDGDLSVLDKNAQTALKACRAKNPDPSVGCPAAAAILGVK